MRFSPQRRRECLKYNLKFQASQNSRNMILGDFLKKSGSTYILTSYYRDSSSAPVDTSATLWGSKPQCKSRKSELWFTFLLRIPHSAKTYSFWSRALRDVCLAGVYGTNYSWNIPTKRTWFGCGAGDATSNSIGEARGIIIYWVVGTSTKNYKNNHCLSSRECQFKTINSIRLDEKCHQSSMLAHSLQHLGQVSSWEWRL